MNRLLVCRIPHAVNATKAVVFKRHMGFWSNLFIDSERDKRKQAIQTYSLVPGEKAWFDLYQGLEPSQLAKETGVPDQLIDDPLLHIAMLKYNRVKAMYNITDDADFLEKYDVSAGVQTLEAALPVPIPAHTFDELPIIKEPEDEKPPHVEAAKH